jgi:DUF2924 family protein
MQFTDAMFLGMHPQKHGPHALKTGEFSIGISGEYSSGTDSRKDQTGHATHPRMERQAIPGGSRRGRLQMNGERFRSLSAIALHTTGTTWSGPRFFGLTKASVGVP